MSTMVGYRCLTCGEETEQDYSNLPGMETLSEIFHLFEHLQAIDKSKWLNVCDLFHGKSYLMEFLDKHKWGQENLDSSHACQVVIRDEWGKNHPIIPMSEMMK